MEWSNYKNYNKLTSWGFLNWRKPRSLRHDNPFVNLRVSALSLAILWIDKDIAWREPVWWNLSWMCGWFTAAIFSFNTFSSSRTWFRIGYNPSILSSKDDLFVLLSVPFLTSEKSGKIWVMKKRLCLIRTTCKWIC